MADDRREEFPDCECIARFGRGMFCMRDCSQMRAVGPTLENMRGMVRKLNMTREELDAIMDTSKPFVLPDNRGRTRIDG